MTQAGLLAVAEGDQLLVLEARKKLLDASLAPLDRYEERALY